MAENINPDVTPNVVLGNPTVRLALNWIVGAAAIIVPALAIVDSNSALDFGEWLPAATGVTSFLAGLLGVVVTVPNIPKREKAVVTEEVHPEGQ